MYREKYRECFENVLQILSFSANEGKATTEVEGYDVATNTWTQLAPMRAAACSVSHVEFQGKLYLVGGLSLTGPAAAVQAMS